MPKPILPKQTLSKPGQSNSNDLVYFLASLCLFIIIALMTNNSTTFFR